MDFDQAFEAIAAAMTVAASKGNDSIASTEAERQGLANHGAGERAHSTVWQKSSDDKTLWYQYRYYDPSQVFSIRPDVNILTLELREGDRVLRRAEERYEDSFPRP